MRTCIVCSIPYKSSSKPVSFHRFPKDIILRNKWISVCKVEEKIKILNDPVICSNHFQKSDFEEYRKSYNILKKGSVPSKFLNCVSPEPQTSNTVQNHCLPLNQENESRCDFQSSSSDDARYTGDLTVDHFQKSDFEEYRKSCNILRNKGCVSSKFLDCVPPEPQTLQTPNTVQNHCLPLHQENESRCDHSSSSDDARYIGDLTVEHFRSPRRAKRHIDMVQKYVGEQREIIKRLKRENKKLTVKINSIEDLLSHICDQNLLNQERKETLMDSIPDSVKDLLSRQLASNNASYTPELRSFALTLHFYSPKAYQFIRSAFKNLLPHPRTIQRWYSVVDGEPGFTKEAFEAVKFRAKNSRNLKPIVVNLVLDEMSIKQKIEYSGNKFHGYVEIGANSEVNQDPEHNKVEATNALVFMAVALNEGWKVPLGYFLIKTLNAEERSNILKQCLILLEETGVKCHSITFDGAAVNIAMCKTLGANYTMENFKPSFPHPVTDKNVYTFFDACHMLKLCRNAFCDKNVLYDLNGLKIEWQYIKNLVELQQSEGLRAANKLTNRHINYKNEIMKVFLAAQTMSASVASALCLCKESIKGFEHCEATANFCLIINNIFDILNCKNKFSNRQFLKPLNDQNFDYIKEKAVIYINYLKKLKDCNGLLIVSNRKIGFLGFIIDLTNLLDLYTELKAEYNFEYILSFKLSQDHIETFFSAVRSRGGYNNNPSCLQFKAAYKKLLVKHEISGSKYGNCSILDAANILHVSSGIKSKTTDLILEDLAEFELDLNLENENYFFLDNTSLSSFTEDIVIYISGFVSKKAKSKILCEICSSQLTSTETDSKLIKFKNRGNLSIPSKCVIKICMQLERAIRATEKAKLISKNNIKEILTLQTLRKLPDLFNSESMIKHIQNQTVMDNHRIQLIKVVCKIYLHLRIHYECKKIADNHNKNKIRSKYNKLVLFKNQ